MGGGVKITGRLKLRDDKVEEESKKEKKKVKLKWEWGVWQKSDEKNKKKSKRYFSSSNSENFHELIMSVRCGVGTFECVQ